jgi:Flp pilus assembly pilin Flp
MRRLYSLLKWDDGQTMTEYATTLSVITLSCLTTFALLAAASTGAFTRVVGYFT